MQRRRARGADQKLARRRQICDAASALFAESPYDGVTMAAVAERAGVAKGTPYVYFETKDVMFLAVTEELIGDWLDRLDAWLATQTPPVSTRAVADWIGTSFADAPLLPRALAVLHTTIEHGIDVDRARLFKMWLGGRMAHSSELLAEQLPDLDRRQAMVFLRRLAAVVIGLQHQAEPSSAVREVLGDPQMELFVVDLAAEIRVIARGLLEADR